MSKYLVNTPFKLKAEMRGDACEPHRAPSQSGVDGWEGPVFLPKIRCGKGHPGNLFFARIRGQTQTYPFLSAHDSVTIRSWPDGESLQTLLDSQFVAKEWVVREDATHAKSKTYRRSEVDLHGDQ